jgi:hypothetical protein
VEKRGLRAALAAAGLTAASLVVWADELRVGLHGMVRRVWGRRGVKVRKRVQLSYRWRYLVLAVDGRSGRVWWNWSETMAADDLIPLVRGMKDTTDLAAVVWDGAPSHRDGRLSRIGLPLIALPPYAPELNPAERVFEELRAAIEGEVYPTLDDKVARVEAILQRWDADPDRVQRLTGWAWIHDAFAGLPDAPTPPAIAA